MQGNATLVSDAEGRTQMPIAASAPDTHFTDPVRVAGATCFSSPDRVMACTWYAL
jgi:hypothetical protein